LDKLSTEDADQELDDAALEAQELEKVKEDQAIAAGKVKYYEAKAKFDQANGMVKDQDAVQAKAQANVDKVKFTPELTEGHKKELAAKVDKFLNAKAKEGEDQAEVTARNLKLLQSLEQDGEFKVSVLKKKMEKKPTDRTKTRYYTAKADLDYVVEYLGDRSPAKAAKKAKRAEAERARALEVVAEALGSAKSAKDIAIALKNATKGASPVAATLMEAKTNKAVREVLRMAAKDRKTADILAEALLSAKNLDDVAKAFSSIKLKVLESQQAASGEVN